MLFLRQTDLLAFVHFPAGQVTCVISCHGYGFTNDVSRKQLASNQQYNALPQSLQELWALVTMLNRWDCRDDERTPPCFNQQPHAVGAQSFQYFN
jgi:hypothetical protein